MKLALGTVQFGLEYGAFNNTGRPANETVRAMLDFASASGINILDTARAYGDSEEVLGALNAAKRFSIVTKVATLDGAGSAAIARSLDTSLAALRTDQIGALMLHAAADLMSSQGDENWRALERLRDSGRCARIGVSVYRPEEARTILDRYPLSIIQLPANILDQRFARAGILDLCRDRGVDVHVRSAFLQGFLLAEPDALPTPLQTYRSVLEKFIAHARDRGLSRAALALAPLLADERISAVVVGADSLSHLEQLVEATRLEGGIIDAIDQLAIEDEALLNPGNWH